MHTLRLLLDARRAHQQGTEALLARQRDRLAEIVAHARSRSGYYRELYHGLPERITDPALLPVTSKKQLMPRFDDWVTDPAATLTDAQAFVDDPARIGEKFLGRYTLLTTSGTTGTRGLFLLDRDSLAVTTALSTRMLGAWITPRDIVRIAARGGRIAMVNATGGHFASAVAAAGLRKNPLRRRRIGVFPVQLPLPDLVARLNAFRPAILTPYATTGALLAGEQQAGRLHIDPVLVVLSAEGLPAAEYDRIATAFGATVRQGYAATECPFLTYSCRENWLHVNSDWAILEPVDADHQPVPPGTRSHTTLLTNLANRAQPILRYDLGDAILLRPDPCPCGDPLPAIHVQGRTADLLTFPTQGGGSVTITPLTLSALLDHVPGIELVQIVQTSPTDLRIRLQATADADPEHVWHTTRTEIDRLLTGHHLTHVTLTRATEPPQQTAGGKYRTVIPHTGSPRDSGTRP
ncbi:Phenylacetate-coenzyme A ligase PaaK, adenylate-forming domain family [Lentzea albidocapillata subsp. violacea]|uniref:Phenylacetate-coenzyme A ligase PaaK, adenylate-forming domain family n=1 Tax=Lentzea albidocapillata subsp. violacea TaxID=128104 RepID=A0A1G9WUS4_9PSEU|nr:CoF synthetase [Lentzea albidocapillata]SDM88218.1 Phenylacetate-coenzyme A ligase PaaK, adenylate-forming domain family [Lentzea albidocapillata subsp. violacea]